MLLHVKSVCHEHIYSWWQESFTKLHTCNCKDRKGIYLHVVYCSCNKLDILLRLAMQQTNIYILFILIDLIKEIFTPFIPTFLKQKMHSLEYLNFLNPKKVIEKKTPNPTW